MLMENRAGYMRLRWALHDSKRFGSQRIYESSLTKSINHNVIQLVTFWQLGIFTFLSVKHLPYPSLISSDRTLWEDY